MVIEGKVIGVRPSVIQGLSYLEIEEGAPELRYARLRISTDDAKEHHLGDWLRITVDVIPNRETK